MFQLHKERRKRGQFRDTVGALKTLASTEFKQDGRYLEPLFRPLQDPVPPLPIKPKGEVVLDPNDGTKTITLPADEVELDVFKAELTEYVKQKERLKQTKTGISNIVIAQCSKPLKNKLKGINVYDNMKQNGDVAGILQAIRDLSNQIEENVSPYETLDELHKKFFLYRQIPGEDKPTHLTKFKEAVDVLKHNGSTLRHDAALINYEVKQAGAVLDSEVKACTAIARNKHLATYFLRRANMGLYGPLLRELRDQRLHGNDLYPKNMADAYSLLENHSSGKRRTTTGREEGRTRTDNVVQVIQHAQKGERGKASGRAIAGLDGRFISNRQCHSCYRYEHYSDQCPEANESNSDRQQYHMHEAIIEEVDSDNEDEEGSMIISFTYMTNGMTELHDKNTILLDTLCRIVRSSTTRIYSQEYTGARQHRRR